jgi:hypothetical protein
MNDRMKIAIGIGLSFAGLILLPMLTATRVSACCAVGRSGVPVVNADQTVIILWDAATKTEHFIRQASFQSDADDFAFLVPIIEYVSAGLPPPDFTPCAFIAVLIAGPTLRRVVRRRTRCC